MRTGISIILTLFVLTVAHSTSAQAQTFSTSPPLSEPIYPIPLHIEINQLKSALGRDLFMDPRLSRDDTVACVSCHPLESGGVDGLDKSIGVEGRIGTINTPTVYNTRFNFVQFWDGRAQTLAEQVSGPIHNPNEMGTNWNEIIGKLNKDPSYQGRFKDIYPDGMTEHNIQDAIAEFENSLFTPNSPFDQFLRGDKSAISSDAQQGYLLFKAYGCSACHQGVNIGGNMYEKLGVVHDYFQDRGHITQADFGRFNFTKVDEHKYEFKVPSLRNIALTAPYFHDGSTKTLDEAVTKMAWYQLGRKIPFDERTKIVKFLYTLTGEHEELKP